MKLFHVVSWNKSVIYLLSFTSNAQSTYPILRTTYQNNFLFSRVNRVNKQLRKCLAYLTDKTKIR